MNITHKTKSWINLIAFFITLAFNALGSFGFINGMSQKAVSDKYHTLITPAPITFSIWGLIYLFVLLSLIMMLVKEKEIAVKKLIDVFTPFFLLSSLFNILWIISFSYEKIGLSAILISLLLLSLLAVNKKLLEHSEEIYNRFTGIPFGLYAGWLTIATVVNIAAYLVSINWDGLGIPLATWATVILLISLLAVFLINKTIKNAVYPLPVAWAFLGILLKDNRLAENITYGSYINPVTMIGIVVLLLISIIQFRSNHYSVLKKNPNKD